MSSRGASSVAEGTGLGVFDSRHVRILHSSFRHNPHVGIKPVRTTNGVVKGNLVAHSGDEGFLMEGGEGFQIRHNRLVRNGAGIALGPGSNNVIARNRVLRGRDDPLLGFRGRADSPLGGRDREGRGIADRIAGR